MRKRGLHGAGGRFEADSGGAATEIISELKRRSGSDGVGTDLDGTGTCSAV